MIRFLAVFVLFGFFLGFASAEAQPPPPAEVSTAAPPLPDILSQLDNALTEVVRKTRTSLVTLEGDFSPGDNPSYLRTLMPLGILQFVPAPEAAGKVGLRVIGSGFVMKGGFVITTSEVASQMHRPVVTFSDGRQAKASLIRHDPSSNIAVFHVEGLPSETGVVWGASDKVAAGNLAITIGNQAGYAHSASLGMVSGVGRAGRSGELRYSNLIQFQGTIGVGNSGSPLFNSHGELIGMIVATPASTVNSRQKTAAGGVRLELEGGEMPFGNLSSVGFAIPANEVRAVAVLLRDGKAPQVRSGWLGVHLEIPKQMGGGETPALIRALFADSPAERAGLQAGDLVLAVNEKKAESPRELRSFLREVKAGETVKFKVQRGDAVLFISVIADPRPEESTIRKMRRREKPVKTGEAEVVVLSSLPG